MRLNKHPPPTPPPGHGWLAIYWTRLPALFREANGVPAFGPVEKLTDIAVARAGHPSLRTASSALSNSAASQGSLLALQGQGLQADLSARASCRLGEACTLPQRHF
jgi:hypothetical protein